MPLPNYVKFWKRKFTLLKISLRLEHFVRDVNALRESYTSRRLESLGAFVTYTLNYSLLEFLLTSCIGHLSLAYGPITFLQQVKLPSLPYRKHSSPALHPLSARCFFHTLPCIFCHLLNFKLILINLIVCCLLKMFLLYNTHLQIEEVLTEIRNCIRECFNL